jgi:hypothetical protein
LKYANGLGPVHEIHGGAGYLSQDSAVPVLGMATSPTHVVIRWPGGKSTETPVPAGTNEVIVSH